MTKLGKRVTKDAPIGGNEEMRVLQYLRDNKTATEDELSIAGGEGWLLRRLKQRGLIRELTNG